MIELKDEITIAEEAGTLMTHVDALRHMTVMQWVTLAGYAIVGAGTGFATTSHDWIGAVIGALGGVIAHLVPLMQTSPVDRAAQARAAAKANAEVAQVEAAGRTEVAHADPKKSAEAAAADFSKEMSK
jgi:hypothetical protein